MKAKALILTSVFIASNSNVFALTGGAISNELLSAENFGAPVSVAGGAKDPIVTYSNPASLADIGKLSVTGGGHLEFYGIERKGSGVSDSMEDQTVFVPSFGLAQSFGDGKFGFGLAVVSPYGLKTEWSETSNVRYVATDSVLKMYDITPAVSYRHNEKFAVGLGLDYFNVFDASLQRKFNPVIIDGALNPPTFTPSIPSAPDGNTKLEGDGSQWGYHGGLLFQPTERHSFGLAYHSEVKMELEGTIELKGIAGTFATTVFGGSNFTTPAKADIFFPQNVLIGYAFTPNEKWRFEVDGHWYDWSSNKQLLPRAESANAFQRAIVEAPLPLEWKDIWSFGLGTTYRASDMWKINGGWYYISAAVPDRTFAPIIPDSDRWGLTIGPSFTKGSLTIDAVYSPLFYKDRNINNNIGEQVSGIPGYNINGEYSADIHIVGLNFKYQFQ